MKKFKKGIIFTSLILVLVMIFTLLTTIDFDGNINSNPSINISNQTKISFTKLNQDETLIFKYEILSEDDLTVSIASVDRNGSTSQSYYVELPSTVSYGDKNYTVVEIGDSAFDSKGTLITGIKIPASVERVGYRAFAKCSSLASIDLSSVKSIGEEAFLECKGLTSVFLSNEITEIKSKTFYGAESLKNITIPDSCISIGESAFRNSGLVTIRVGKGLKRIDSYAFANLDENGNPSIADKVLQNIYFAGVAPICGENVFANAKDEFKIYRSNKKHNGWDEDYNYLSYDGNWTVLQPEGISWMIGTYNSSFNVLDFVKTEGQTFVETSDNQRVKYRLDLLNNKATVISFENVNEETIIIPSSVIFDGDNVFEVNCIDSESTISNDVVHTIVINSTIESDYFISSDAFTNLSIDTLCLNVNNATLSTGALNGIAEIVTVYSENENNINGLNEYSNNHFISYNLEDGLDKQGVYYTIKDGYAVVGESYDGDDERANTSRYEGNGYYAYNQENGFVVLPDYVTIDGAFYKVRSIGRYAFYNNEYLKNIKIGAFIGEEVGNSTETVEDPFFAGVWDCSLRNCLNLTGFVVDSRNKYLLASDCENWSSVNVTDFAPSVTYPFLFELGTRGTDVVPRKVIKASLAATKYSGIPEVTSAEAYAFANCTNLVDVNTSYFIRYGNFAFAGSGIGASSDAFVLDLMNVKEVGNYAFENCYGITEVKNFTNALDEPDSRFGALPFKNCENIVKFSMDLGVAPSVNYLVIDELLFKKENDGNSYYLTLLQYPANKSNVEYNLNTKSWNSLNLDVRRIEAYAFENADNLEIVTLGEQVNIIGKAAFSNCTHLKKIEISKNVHYIGLEMLTDNTDGKHITYNDVVADINTQLDKYENITRIDDVSIYEQEVFEGCLALSHLFVNKDNPFYTTDNNGILYNKDKTTLLLYPAGVSRTTYTISSSVTKIALEAFENNRHIQRLIVPEGVTEVGAKAFNGCTNLKWIYFRTIDAPVIGEQVFNSTGATNGGLTVYCIPLPEAWVMGKEILWDNYMNIVDKYNAIQEIPNESVTTDALYTIYVVDSDGNYLNDIEISVTCDGGVNRKATTGGEGYAFFTVPSQEVLIGGTRVKNLTAEDPSGIYYAYSVDNYELDLYTCYSTITMVSVPTPSGYLYEEVKREPNDEGKTLVRNRTNIETETLTINKASLASNIGGFIIDMNGEYIASYVYDIRLYVRAAIDPNVYLQNIKIVQISNDDNSVKELAVYDLINSANSTAGAGLVSGTDDMYVFLIDPMKLSVSELDDIEVQMNFYTYIDGTNELTKIPGTDTPKLYTKSNKLNFRAYEYVYGENIDEVFGFGFEDVIKIKEGIPIIGGLDLGFDQAESGSNDKGFKAHYYKDKFILSVNVDSDLWGIIYEKEEEDGEFTIYNPLSKKFGTKHPREYSNFQELIKALKDDEVNLGEKGHKIKFNIKGAVELTRSGRENTPYMTNGFIKGTITFEFWYGQTWIVWVIPVVLEVEFNLEAGFQLTLASSEFDEEKTFWENNPITLTFGIDATLYGGVGCRFASVGIYGSAGLDMAIRIGDTSYLESIYMTFDLGAYIKANLGFVKFSKKFSFFGKAKTIQVYARESDSGGGSWARFAVRDSYGITREFDTVEDALAYSLSTIDGSLYPSNYEYGYYGGVEPTIVNVGSDTYQFYVDDVYANKTLAYDSIRTGADEYNYLKIVYRKLVDGVWQDPVVLNPENNLNESEFDICVIDGKIHIIYTHANEKINSSNAGDYSKNMSISYKELSSNMTGTAIKISDNVSSTYKSNISLQYINGKIYAGWTENSDGNVLGVANESQNDNYQDAESVTFKETLANSIVVKNLTDGTNVIVKNNLHTITNLELVNLDGKGYVSYVIDDNCNLSDTNDRILNVISLADTSKTYSSDAITIEGIEYSNNKLLLHNGVINNVTISNNTLNVSEYIKPAYSDYKIIYKDGNIYGITYIINEEIDETVVSSNIYFSFYDSVNNKFSNPIATTNFDVEQYVDAYDYYWYQDKLYFVINYYEHLLDEEAVEDEGLYEAKDLFYCVTEPLGKDNDLVLEGVSTDISSITPNEEFEIIAEIFNNSFEPVSNIKGELLLGGEIIITSNALVYNSSTGEWDLSEGYSLLPGEKAIVKFTYVLSEVSQKYEIRVTSDLIEDEAELINNSKEIQLASADLMINVKVNTIGDVTYLLVFVQNIGNLATTESAINDELNSYLYISNGAKSPFDTSYNGDDITGNSDYVEEDDALYSIKIGALKPLEYKYYTIELNKVYFTEPVVTVYAKSAQDDLGNYEEVDLDNNIYRISIIENEVLPGTGDYNVIYYVDGTEYMTLSYEVGMSVSLIDVPSKYGYTFNGWHGAEDEFIMPGHDVIVYGYYNINIHSISYRVNGVELYRDQYHTGATVLPRDVESKEGYSFVWDEIPEIMPDEDVVINGYFTINTYVIQYYVDGVLVGEEDYKYNETITSYDDYNYELPKGYKITWDTIPSKMPSHDLIINATTNVISYTLVYNIEKDGIKDKKIISLPYASKIDLSYVDYLGYDFSGWYLDESYTLKITNDKMMPDTMLELYGKYEPKIYTLSYYVEGTLEYSEDVAYGTKITPFVVEGVEWLNCPDTMPAYDVNVFCKKSENIHAVVYHVDGVEYYKDYFQYKTIVYVRPNEIKEGYTFSGWKLDNTLISTSFVMSNEDIHLYAEFTPNVYQINYYVDGKFVNTENYEYGKVVSEYKYTDIKLGYELSDWSENITTMPARNVSLYATTSLKLYNISYYVDGEHVLTNQVLYNTRIIPYVHEVSEGINISGWEGLPVDLLMPAGDLVVTATTSPVVSTITYYVDGNKVYEKDYEYGSNIEEFVPQIEQGYIFVGFENIPSKMPAEDIIVYGYTKLASYNIYYYIDGVLTYTDTYLYNSLIIPRGQDPQEKGYILWQEIPTRMPAEDIRIDGTFVENTYCVYYYCDNILVYTDLYNINETHTVRPNETKEGYEFSGWGLIDTESNNIIYVGYFNVKQYEVQFYIGDTLYKTVKYDYGTVVSLSDELLPANVEYWMVNNEKVSEITINVENIVINAKVKGNSYLVPIALISGACVCAAAVTMVIVKTKKKPTDEDDYPKKKKKLTIN